MPRIAGVSLVGGLLATLAIYAVGALWFGLIFDQMWMDANGYTIAQIEENFSLPIFAGGGFIIPLILAFAIGWLLKQTGTRGLVPSVVFGAKVALFIAAPILAYGFVYDPVHSVTDLVLDVSHSFVGFTLGAAVLSFFD